MVPQTGLRGAGVMVAVVGPSGSGKDTLIAVARERYAGNRWVVFPQRIVTRNSLPEAENHASVSEQEFAAIDHAGGFATSWRAHGLAYGIAASIDADIRDGRVVVANVSRQAIDPLRRRYPTVHVASVTAREEILTRRLKARGRESDAEIARRVARARSFARPRPPLTVIDNSGALADAADAFLNVLASYVPAGGADAGW